MRAKRARAAGRPPVVTSFAQAKATGRLDMTSLAGSAQLTADVPSLVERRPDCPGALTSLVHRCLAKEPEQRPRAEEVLHELVEFACATSGDRTSELLDDVGFRRSLLLDERDTWVDPNAAPRAMLEHKRGPREA